MDRYDLEWSGSAYMESQSMEKVTDGDWVKYEDHKAEVERLKQVLLDAHVYDYEDLTDEAKESIDSIKAGEK